MAAEKQHTELNDVVEQEPLTGLNLISDTPVNVNTFKKSTALAEIDPNLVSKANDNTSATTESKSAADAKHVSIAGADEEIIGADSNLEVALPEGEDIEDNLDNDVRGPSMQMGVGEKKKKNRKKKPKSQRGLVGSLYIDTPKQC